MKYIIAAIALIFAFVSTATANNWAKQLEKSENDDRQPLWVNEQYADPTGKDPDDDDGEDDDDDPHEPAKPGVKYTNPLPKKMSDDDDDDDDVDSE